MNIKDFGINTFDIGDVEKILDLAKYEISIETSKLSDSDKLKFDELVKDMDTNDVSSIKSKLQDLNNIKDAKN